MTPTSIRSPGRAWFAALVAAAIALRLLAVARSLVIESDGAYYAGLAGALLRGDLAHAFSTVWPPLYPFLIAAAAWAPHALGAPLTPELLEGAARAVSLLAGLALLVPLYRLAHRLAGDEAALVTVAFAAVHPRLVQYSAAALTESTFTLLLAAGVLAWLARQRLLAGAALGLATLARPEGLAVAALLAAGSVLEPASAGRRGRAAFVLALLLVILPYTAFVSAATGSVSLGDKGGYNFWRTYKVEYARVLPEPTGLSERVVDSPELADRLPRSRVNVAGFIARAPGVVAARSARNAARIAVSSLPLAVYPAFALLAVAGAFVLPWRVAWPLVAPIPLFALIYAPFTSDRRFFVPLTPFVLVLAAAGVARIGAWLARGVPGRGEAFARGLAALLVLGYGVYACVGVRALDDATEHRVAGVWLRRHVPPAAEAGRPRVVMSRKPWVAYYSGALNAELPEGSLADVEARIGRVGAEVLVVDDRWAVPQRPAVAPLRDPSRAPAGMATLLELRVPMPLLLYDVSALQGNVPR